MKKGIYLLIAVSMYFYPLISCNSSGQNHKNTLKESNVLLKEQSRPSLIPTDTLAYASTIENFCDSVHKNLAHLKMKKRDDFDGSAEGGEVRVYTSKTDTLKVEAVYYGETGKNEYEIYVRYKNPVFFKERTTYYHSPIGKIPVQTDSVISHTFLLKTGKVLIGKKGNKLITAHEKVQKANDINSLYKEIISIK